MASYTNIKVHIFNKQETFKVPSGLRLLIRKCCTAVFQEENINFSSELDVTFVDDEQIRKLNLKHRNKDSVTDVLSFPLGKNGLYDKNPENGNALLGDIVISLETAKKQADLYGHSFNREIAYLTVHSLLHLLGYDHEDNSVNMAQMREKEEIILGKLGLSKLLTYIKKQDEYIY